MRPQRSIRLFKVLFSVFCMTGLSDILLGVVLAFKAVYKLEVTRQQNDKRIISLLQQMKDMVEVLIR